MPVLHLYSEANTMNSTKIVNDYPVFIRACEGLPFLALVVTFLAISWILHREPLF